MAAVGSKRIRLGDLLLRAGVITEEQLRSALADQKRWGGKLGSLLVRMKYLDEDMLVKALSKQLGLPRVDFNGLMIPGQALDKLEPDFAEQYQILPISLDIAKGLLVVATADPDNLGLADEIAFMTGCRVKVAIAGERALAHAIREHYFGDNIAPPGSPDGGEPMKLLNPLGSTMVRHIDDIKKEAGQARSAAAPAFPSAPRQPVSIEDRLKRLEALQHKEVLVLKTVVELLIAKGFITREEYRQKVEQ